MQDVGSVRSWGDKGCWNRSGTAGAGQTRDSGWEQIRNSRHETDNRITEIIDEGGGYVHSKKKVEGYQQCQHSERGWAECEWCTDCRSQDKSSCPYVYTVYSMSTMIPCAMVW